MTYNKDPSRLSTRWRWGSSNSRSMTSRPRDDISGRFFLMQFISYFARNNNGNKVLPVEVKMEQKPQMLVRGLKLGTQGMKAPFLTLTYKICFCIDPNWK